MNMNGSPVYNMEATAGMVDIFWYGDFIMITSS